MTKNGENFPYKIRTGEWTSIYLYKISNQVVLPLLMLTDKEPNKKINIL
jgi:hypothetical protein